MSQILDAKVVLSHCNRDGRLYGMLVEERTRGNWFIKWTFPISEQRAKSEHFDKTTIDGNIEFADEYPGCAYCKQYGFWNCPCGAYHCWDGKDEVYCTVCKRTTRIGGTITSLEGGGDI